MKKFIYSLLIVFITGTVLTSCEKEYLETHPTDAVSAALVTLTTDNMWAGLNGIHRALYERYQSQQGCGGIGAFWIVMDRAGDDCVQNASQWFRQVYRWEANVDLTQFYNLFPWRTFYQWISNANILINGAEGATGSQSDKNAIVGQSLVYRAWSHFNILRIYAKRYNSSTASTDLGIPYMKENLTEGQARNTIADCYTNIMADLDEAITLLDGYSPENKSHISQDVAKGIKARVALEMGNYTLAATLAHEVKANYTLMDFDTYKNGFRTNSQLINEFMWASQIISIEQNDKWASYGAYISRNFNSTAIRANPSSISAWLYAQISDTDVRKTLFSEDGLHTDLQPDVSIISSAKKYPYTNQKFISVDQGDSRVDVPLMRAAEMYLIEAEALARQGGKDSQAADVLYDLAITRDPSYTLSTNTGQDLIDEIIIQRRVELWGEGFRWLDLKRLGEDLDRRDKDGITTNHTEVLAAEMHVPASDRKWVWLIPKDEMDANPNMVQNDL